MRRAIAIDVAAVDRRADQVDGTRDSLGYNLFRNYARPAQSVSVGPIGC
jgi:hypothetical protein